MRGVGRRRCHRREERRKPGRGCWRSPATDFRKAAVESIASLLAAMRMARKVARSRQKTEPELEHLIVAARGVLYISASSPNVSPDL